MDYGLVLIAIIDGFRTATFAADNNISSNPTVGMTFEEYTSSLQKNIVSEAFFIIVVFAYWRYYRHSLESLLPTTIAHCLSGVLSCILWVPKAAYQKLQTSCPTFPRQYQRQINENEEDGRDPMLRRLDKLLWLPLLPSIFAIIFSALELQRVNCILANNPVDTCQQYNIWNVQTISNWLVVLSIFTSRLITQYLAMKDQPNNNHTAEVRQLYLEDLRPFENYQMSDMRTAIQATFLFGKPGFSKRGDIVHYCMNDRSENPRHLITPPILCDAATPHDHHSSFDPTHGYAEGLTCFVRKTAENAIDSDAIDLLEESLKRRHLHDQTYNIYLPCRGLEAAHSERWSNVLIQIIKRNDHGINHYDIFISGHDSLQDATYIIPRAIYESLANVLLARLTEAGRLIAPPNQLHFKKTGGANFIINTAPATPTLDLTTSQHPADFPLFPHYQHVPQTAIQEEKSGVAALKQLSELLAPPPAAQPSLTDEVLKTFSLSTARRINGSKLEGRGNYLSRHLQPNESNQVRVRVVR